MPRLCPRALSTARKIHPLLPLTLRATRNIQDAKNELRWLKEHAIERAGHNVTGERPNGWKDRLRRLCIERSVGKPLQYILGTEHFGDLEIICEPDVLIPRWETALSVSHLVRRLSRASSSIPDKLKILDLCTGTGCIPLLFQHDFRSCPKLSAVNLECTGIDISTKSIELAKRNLVRLNPQFKASTGQDSIQFLQADVLANACKATTAIPPVLERVRDMENADPMSSMFEILISNPPYISPSAFRRTTTRSVRTFEPKLALVPDTRQALPGVDLGDTFYPRLLEIADEVDTKVVMFEVADMAQARRVASMMKTMNWAHIEIWRDQPTMDGEGGHSLQADDVVKDIAVCGHGEGRSVFAARGPGIEWTFA